MRIDKELAITIATAAITEHYRQVHVLTTRDFVRWLKDRDIPFQWETLHHLWELGVLHPIAVLEPAIYDKLNYDRFLEINLQYEKKSFVDLGQEVPENCRWSPPLFKLPSHLADSLLWHPFQLWIIDRLARILKVSFSLDSSIYATPEAFSKSAHKLVSSIPKNIAEYANSTQYAEFLKILALLLLAEPLVHPLIEPSIRLSSFSGESLDEYFSWRNSFPGKEMLDNISLTVGEVEQWHNTLASNAQIHDHIDAFRILLRHANRRRLERLKGPILLAYNLYDHAEILRRYLEQYFNRELLEEDDVRYGPQGPMVKKRLYGSPRTADFNRTTFRRIVRSFDLDPQARTTWFVEGETEEAYINTMAKNMHIDLEEAGLDIMNVHGLGGLSGRNLRALLERFQREEIFSFVSVDYDRCAKHLHDLQNYAQKGLLPIGYQVWKPDFEIINFSLEELAEIANNMALRDGITTAISAAELKQEMDKTQKPIGKVIAKLLQRHKYYEMKGPKWGIALSDWAISHTCPKHIADDRGNRRIDSIMLWMLQGQQSEYWGTTVHFKVDDEGKLVEI